MTTDFRNILKSELEIRTKRNPAYSLRAFAQTVGLHVSQLSDVLNGRKGLSAKSAEQIAGRLRWNKDETEIFVALVKQSHSRSPKEKVAAAEKVKQLKRQKKFQLIEHDQFSIIKDWYHFAILHLFEIDSFQSDAAWIAERLGITPGETKAALERLEKQGLIDRSSPNWKIVKKFISSPNVASSAIRYNLHQMMQKAGAALESQPITERDFSTVTMSVDSSRVAEAKEWLREFRRKFCTDMDQSPKKDSVYCLSIQFFKVSN